MAQFFYYPPDGTSPGAGATAANQAAQIVLETALNALVTTLNNKTAGSLVPTAYDEIDLAYVTVGNGIGQTATATYKLATVTVAVLTMTYDANDKLSSVVKT